jgi:hypothetical protein
MPSTRLALTPEQRAELWFSKIERDVIACRGVFTSLTDLRRKLMRYIKQYNKTAKQPRSNFAPWPIICDHLNPLAKFG